MTAMGTEGLEQGDRRRLGAVVLGLVATATILLPGFGAPTAGAAVVTAERAALTWKVSEHAWSSSSLSPSHGTEAPATKEADGFRFAGGGGTYDRDTGAASIHFGGSFTLGNVVQGGYRIRIANPHLVLAGDGTGEVRADVAHCASATACTTTGFTTVAGVVVAELAGVTLSVDGAVRSATVTPEFELVPGQSDGLRQFPQPLLDALPASLQGHFRQTGSGADGAKAPAPLTFAFEVQEPATTTSTSISTSTSTSTTSTTTSTTLAPTTSTTVAPSTTSTSTVPSTTSTTTPAAGDPLTAGTLDWGVKASFRSYITGPIAHGSATPSAGAAGNGDGTFRFPLASGTLAADALDAAFEGSVRFTGHDGALDLTLSDPRVEVDGDEGILVVDARSLALGQTEPTTFDDVTFAALDLSAVAPQVQGNQVVLADVPAVLTESGAPAFAGFYEAGTALDPLTLTVATAGTLPPPAEPTTTTTATTVTGSGGVLPRTGDDLYDATRLALLLVGVGLLLTGRRLGAG